MYSNQKEAAPSDYQWFTPPNFDYQVGLLEMSTFIYREKLLLLGGRRDECVFRSKCYGTKQLSMAQCS